MSDPSAITNPLLPLWSAAGWGQASSYMIDAWQRNVLFLDVLRQRGNQYHDHMAERVPHVLQFSGELVLNGRGFERPVNYGLIRITPPEGVEIDPLKRPFIVFDPRAGHGPGIGGFKADSELGVAMRAGHPAYFVGFLPNPEPGQTVEDVVMAEIRFVEHVGRLHDKADGKPVVIGNCQAGWQVMMAAALRPDLFGPIILAGSPLSYWAGQPGGSPMRYTGGLLGGSWLTALTGDLGGGIFDGAWLVQNFENMNPANTLWSKQYNLYSKVDTEAPRYLEFERWWGGHVLLNADEMQYIVDQLFVGNRLATAEIVTSDGRRIDFRNIRSPIVVFCSKGDDITPPAQALGWITDLYGSLDEIRANGQTIVYAVHESIGHLGIFVSTKVARMEHEQFASNIDLIDVLPPGLYEAELREAGPEEPNAALVETGHISRFAARDLDDIRAIVGSDAEEERRFAAVARLSRINLGLYRTCLQPTVRQAMNATTAETLRRAHPLRVGYEIFSDHNPFLRGLAAMADLVRQNRRPVEPQNIFHTLEKAASEAITASLDGFRQATETASERVFNAVYGAPAMQALLGLTAEDDPPRRHPGQEWERLEHVRQRITELRERIGEGGLRKAALRALLHVGIAGRIADQRAFALLRRMRDEQGSGVTLQDFKAALREQFLMLLLDQEAALAALPGMLAEASGDDITAMLERLESVLTVDGPLSGEAASRWTAIEAMFRSAAARNAAVRPAKRAALAAG